MEIIKFFKTLKKKINTLDKMAPKTNPFSMPNQITLIWIEEECPLKEKFD